MAEPRLRWCAVLVLLTIIFGARIAQAESPDDIIDERIELGDLCFLPYTSGTTGVPKGSC